MRPRVRPKLRYMDTIRRDMKKNGLTDVNILDRKNCRLGVSMQGDPLTWKTLQGENVRICSAYSFISDPVKLGRPYTPIVCRIRISATSNLFSCASFNARM